MHMAMGKKNARLSSRSEAIAEVAALKSSHPDRIGRKGKTQTKLPLKAACACQRPAQTDVQPCRD